MYIGYQNKNKNIPRYRILIVLQPNDVSQTRETDTQIEEAILPTDLFYLLIKYELFQYFEACASVNYFMQQIIITVCSGFETPPTKPYLPTYF